MHTATDNIILGNMSEEEYKDMLILFGIELDISVNTRWILFKIEHVQYAEETLHVMILSNFYAERFFNALVPHNYMQYGDYRYTCVQDDLSLKFAQTYQKYCNPNRFFIHSNIGMRVCKAADAIARRPANDECTKLCIFTILYALFIPMSIPRPKPFAALAK